MENRYYSSTNYNLTHLLSHLHTVIENNGGYIACRKGWKSYDKEYMIHNRTVIEAIHEKESMIADLEKWNNSESEKLNEIRHRRISSLKTQLEQLKQDQPKPFVTHFLQSITFVYDGKLYYFQTDQNPFFPFNYQKTDINEKGEIRSTYLEEFSKKDWMFDCLFERETSETDLREIACILFNKLVSAKDTDVYYEDDYKYCPFCGSRHKYKAAKIHEYERVTF